MSEKPAPHDSREVPDAAEKAAPRAVAPLPVYQRSSQRTSYDYVDRSAGSSHDHDGLRLALSVLAGIVFVYEKDGFRVAVLNYTYGLNGYADPKGAVALLDEDRVREDCSSRTTPMTLPQRASCPQ